MGAVSSPSTDIGGPRRVTQPERAPRNEERGGDQHRLVTAPSSCPASSGSVRAPPPRPEPLHSYLTQPDQAAVSGADRSAEVIGSDTTAASCP